MGEGTSIIGSSILATVVNTSGEFPIAIGGGKTLFVSGEISVGERIPVRIIRVKEETLIGITAGAEIKLRIDEVSTEGSSIAYPDYGPVRIDTKLTEGNWYRCRVTRINEDSVEARTLNKIPRRSEINTGPLPQDHTQTLNRLINNKHNDS